MKERMKFLLEWEARFDAGEGRVNFAALCREFGVSRQVGYGWVGRYREAGNDVRVAEERSRRPLHSPTRVSDELEEVVVKLRRLHPTWGPKKLRAWVMHYRPDVVMPAPSTIGEILRRRGLSQRRYLRRRRVSSAAAALRRCDRAQRNLVRRFQGPLSNKGRRGLLPAHDHRRAFALPGAL